MEDGVGLVMKKQMSLKRHFLIMRGGRMGILKINYISEADVTLFDVRLSESEIVIYTDCLNYVWLIYLMNKYTKKNLRQQC